MAYRPGEKLPEPRKLTFATKVDELDARRHELLDERKIFLADWKDIADQARVRRTRALRDGSEPTRNKVVLHEEMMFASRTLGAGMMAGVSSESRPWLRITTPDKDLNEYKGAKLWLETVQRTLYNVFSQSNFYHLKQSAYRDMGDFGQGPIVIDEDFEHVINCYLSPVGEYALGTDYRGTVDTLLRDLRKTTRQLVDRFGGNVPREVRDHYDRGDYETKHLCTHLIQPNVHRQKGERGPLGMPWSSAYWLPEYSDAGDNNLVEVTGYAENPISCPRWDIEPGEVYGDGPGMIALPGSRSLQALEKRKGQIIDKLAVPPLQAPSGMSKDTITHIPGQVSYYPESQGAHAPIQPTYVVQPQSAEVLGNEGMAVGERIRRAYFVDLFLALSLTDRREITAREVDEVHEEKLIQLGPVVQRTHFEGLNHEVKRSFAILARNGALPPPPPELNEMPLKVEYISLLAVAQRAVGATQLERFTGFLGMLEGGNPQVRDKYDDDQAVDEYSEFVGIPASVIRSDDEVKARRDARAEMANRQQMMDSAQQGADIAKTASQAKTGAGDNSTLLADIIGRGGRLL